MTAIVYVNPGGFLGGAERSLIDILRHLDRSRFTPRVVVLSDGPFADAVRALDIHVTQLGLSKSTLAFGQRNPIAAIPHLLSAAIDVRRALTRLRDVLGNERPLVLHANGLKADLLAVWARPSHSWVIWHFRNPLRSSWLRLLFRCAFNPTFVRVIANSRATAASLPRGFAPDVIYNGITALGDYPGPTSERDEAECAAACARRHPDEVLLGAVAHLGPGKGHEVLLDALASVSTTVPKVRLIVVGDAVYASSPRYGEELRHRAERMGVSDRVTFVGQRDPIWPWLRRFDIVVAPSQIEGFGRSVVEAMLAGKAVIAANAGALSEVVSDGETGLLIDPEDADAWASAITRLARDPAERERLGLAARARAESLFRVDRMMERLEQTYVRLGEGEPSRRGAA